MGYPKPPSLKGHRFFGPIGPWRFKEGDVTERLPISSPNSGSRLKCGCFADGVSESMGGCRGFMVLAGCAPLQDPILFKMWVFYLGLLLPF